MDVDVEMGVRTALFILYAMLVNDAVEERLFGRLVENEGLFRVGTYRKRRSIGHIQICFTHWPRIGSGKRRA